MDKFMSIGLLFLSGLPVIEAACENGWSQFGSRCYHLQEESQSFTVAHQACLKMEAALVCIQTSSENDFIKTLITEPSWIATAKTRAALCPTCTTPEGRRDEWRCAGTGTPGSFWKDDQPNSNEYTCAFMDTNGANGWAVADCDAVMPFVCAKGESAETTGFWQKRTPSPTPSRTSPTTKSTTLSTTSPSTTLSTTPSTFTTPTPTPPPIPSSPETTTASETTTTAKPTTKATETELSSTTQTSKDGQYTTEEDGSSSSSEVTTSSTSDVPVASSSGMSDSEYRALYAGLGGLALLILIVVILIILTVKSRKSKKEEEETKNTKVQRPDIVPQIEQQDNPRESFRRPALAAVGFMPKPGGDDVFNSIAPNQSDTMTYTRPPETLENDDIRLTRSHNDPSLLGIDSPLRRPSATASTLTELSQPSAISYRPVSYAGLAGAPSLHKETTTSTQKRLSRHAIGSVIDQSNDTGLYDDDLSPYGETLANPKKRLPRYDPPSVIEQPSYQTTLPTSSDGVDHIKRSRVLQDGSVPEDIYALPAKRKSILRRGDSNSLVDNHIYE